MEGKQSKSLTLALLNINTAKVYLEDVIRDFPGMKRRIDQWIGKLSFVTHDAISCMTPQGRELFRREIKFGDPQQFDHLFQLMAAMSPDQRNLLERTAEAMLKGEIEIVET